MVFKKKEVKSGGLNSVFEKAVEPEEVKRALNKDDIKAALSEVIKTAVVDEAGIKAKSKRKKEDMKKLIVVLGPVPNDRFENPKVGSVNGLKYEVYRGVKTELQRIVVRHIEDHFITSWVQIENADGIVAKLCPRKVYEQIEILNPEPVDLKRKAELIEKKTREVSETMKDYK